MWLQYLVLVAGLMSVHQLPAPSNAVQTHLNSTMVSNSPQFVVNLPDNNLFCFSFEGYELFTYNLITSNFLVINGFLNVYTYWSETSSKYKTMRGFSDIGIIVKAVDKRVRGGKRYFKHSIYEDKKKAVMQGFGEMDMNKGAIIFSLNNGHSDIESQESDVEEFWLNMDKPKCSVKLVSSNDHTFNLYVEDFSGLTGIDMHGLIGQFYNPKVHIDVNKQKLFLASGRVISVQEDRVWETVMDKSYGGRTCWYPLEDKGVIDGRFWDYIVEHIMSVPYLYSLFKN